MTPVRWTEQAVEDMRAIRQFIGRDSPRYGRLVVERLFEATALLEDFPRAGRIVPEIGLETLRELIVGEYRMVYRLEADVPTMLLVFRSSRLLPVQHLNL